MTKAGGSRCEPLLEVTAAEAEGEIQEATVSLAEAEEKVIRTNVDVFRFRMRTGAKIMALKTSLRLVSTCTPAEDPILQTSY